MSTLASQSLKLGARPAVIIVDASNGFTDPSSPLGADFSAEMRVINDLLALARAQAWPVVLSTVAYSTPEQARIFREKLPALNILKAGTSAVEIAPRIDKRPTDHLITKHHASCFHGTELDPLLKQEKCDSLLIAGFTTSGCVRATAVDGLQYGYRSFIIEDAVGDRDSAAHEANLRDFRLKYGEVMHLQTLKDSL